MIKTIIFNLGGVYFTDGTAHAISKIALEYSLKPRAVSDVLKGELGSQYRMGEIDADRFWFEAKKIWRINAPSKHLADIWLSGYTPIHGTIDILDALKTKGYELLFMSDNVKERVEYLEEKYHFLSWFKDGVFSHIAHAKKPDPKIYQLVLDLASHPANECVYMDDKEELLPPAASLGMHTIWFKTPDQLEKDLLALGVTL